MPEGDAVYRTARRLAGALDGRVLTRSDFRVPRYATTDLRGRAVLTTLSRGKHLLTRVEGDLTIHTHLRMDGAWRVTPAGRPAPPGDIARLILANTRWQAIGVRLGVVDLIPSAREADVIGHLGPDLLGPDWDAALAVRNLRKEPTRLIGEALLDQRCLAGIGTIWRAETLFLAGMSPWRAVGATTEGDLERVVTLAHRIMSAGRDSPGPITTGDPRPGRSLFVYGRARRPCRRCGNPIRGGHLGTPAIERLIFWCPMCQPQ